MSLRPEDIPAAWVDAAMATADPGCRDDARAYLANALPTVAEYLAAQIAGCCPECDSCALIVREAVNDLQFAKSQLDA